MSPLLMNTNQDKVDKVESNSVRKISATSDLYSWAHLFYYAITFCHWDFRYTRKNTQIFEGDLTIIKSSYTLNYTYNSLIHHICVKVIFLFLKVWGSREQLDNLKHSVDNREFPITTKYDIISKYYMSEFNMSTSWVIGE